MKRYAVLPILTFVGVLALLSGGCAAPIDSPRDPRVQLTLAGAPVPPAALLTHMTESAALAQVSETPTYERIDDLRTLRQGVESGRIHAGIASTTELAVLRNAGVPIRLLDVFGWNLLYLLAGEKEIDDWESLRGSKVAVPYRGSVHDAIFTRLAAEAGLSMGDDLVMRYASNPLEAAEVLAGKQVQAAVLGEPWATTAIFDGLEEDEPIHRTIDLQAEWGALLGTESRIPQVGFFVTDSLAQERPEIAAALHEALIDAVAWATSDPDAGDEAARLSRLAPDVAADALRNTGLRVVPAPEARAELELLFQVLADANPDLIGGALPDAGFYAEFDE